MIGLAEDLHRPEAVRRAAEGALEAAETGTLSWRVQWDRLPAAAELVAEVTRRTYGDLRIPVHSRWLHFRAGGIDRTAGIPIYPDPVQSGRLRVGLVTVSVLLDAGVGDEWRYREEETGLELGRSEGLAVATLRAFLAGAFSASGDPQADAGGLTNMSSGRLGTLLQAGPSNPVVGLEGRVEMLRRLGRVAAHLPGNRLGGILDLVLARHPGARVEAPSLLALLLGLLAPLWSPSPGDVWQHPRLGVVPLHKLVQWLTYSLVEPLGGAGVEVTDLDRLTALAEYRNGGLLVDTGVLAPQQPPDPARVFAVDSPPVVEWRALTVAVIDRLAEEVRRVLNEPMLSLGQILEGGTWRAGREIAFRLRPGGPPPIRVASDGTVF